MIRCKQPALGEFQSRRATDGALHNAAATCVIRFARVTLRLHVAIKRRLCLLLGTVRNLSKPVECGGKARGKSRPSGRHTDRENRNTRQKRFDGGSALPARLADPACRSKALSSRSFAPLKKGGPDSERAGPVLVRSPSR